MLVQPESGKQLCFGTCCAALKDDYEVLLSFLHLPPPLLPLSGYYHFVSASLLSHDYVCSVFLLFSFVLRWV